MKFDSMMNQLQSRSSQTTTHSTVEEAYKILGATPADDMSAIKKKYRKLVKKFALIIVNISGRHLQLLTICIDNLKTSDHR